MEGDRFRATWWATEIIGMDLSVTMNTMHGPFPYAVHFVDPRWPNRPVEEFFAVIIALEDWCEDMFGPRGRYDRHSGQVVGGTWWSTEARFRFADKTQAAAFKLTWL